MLENFVKKYKGPPVLFIMAGCGTSLSQLLYTPGISKIIEGIHILYGEEDRNNYLGNIIDFPKSVVSDTWVEKTYDWATSLNKKSVIVVVSAAFPSDRIRQGDNHAWYVGSNLEKPQHLVFPKESDQAHENLNFIQHLREEYDKIITRTILSTLTIN